MSINYDNSNYESDDTENDKSKVLRELFFSEFGICFGVVVFFVSFGVIYESLFVVFET